MITPLRFTDRTRTRLVGVLFLSAILAYGTGTALTTSAPGTATSPQFLLGAALMMANSIIVAAIGILLFPLLKRHSVSVAWVYLGGRLIEAVVLIIGVVFLFSKAVEANDLAYQVAMAALGVASVFFCALLLRARLVPRLLALWGIVGYAVFLAGAVLELMGAAGWGLPLSIPGGLFELVFGVWLIAKPGSLARSSNVRLRPAPVG